MLKKGSKLYSIITGNCPKCQKESMYFDKKWFSLTNILKMNEKCIHCGLKYQLEPSFFYGAMYVAYALNVLLMIIVFLVAFFGFHIKTATPVVIAILISLTLLYPIVSRLARNIYINIFVSYDANATNLQAKINKKDID